MSFVFRKITVPLVLLSFLMMAFFSFAGMTYAADGSMKGDCPFSTMGASLCPQSALPSAIHHIFAYQSFLNVPVNPEITAIIIALFIVVSITLIFSFHPFLYGPPAFVLYSPTPFTSEDRKIKRWLSLSIF